MLVQLKTSDNETYTTNKPISNDLQKNRLEELDGKTPVGALLCILKELNWAWDIKVDSSDSVKYIKQNPQISPHKGPRQQTQTSSFVSMHAPTSGHASVTLMCPPWDLVTHFHACSCFEP
ncbi:hypothetical protein PSHT_16369 [Puccinia striiformis]|uniref:Uncharacterized protein n=2 Tax=Puccinia striiformis TaxID=27350 RepID=A0A0L0V706_9BASI|nr:hypothetical protein H4Q26_002788 [Puccinia striiformis f. sp. tritici PST-130]KAI9609059.1 hypothetical protein KEM48_003066 [Puccinia striiformis f. sp. tritici PST-130]KNE94789.1 hypothetical protein PSTG_11881 [Puccinia striiformis f. sp. tritici PST-78]POV94179.1 hypothetical protein PSHT_16369 [Puccinia striiformis]